MSKLIISKRYGIAPNDILNDPNLTFKAKGLFAYIQSKPDDWEFSAERICLQTKDGIDSVSAGLKELEEAGYLTRQKYQDELGHWHCDYLLRESLPGKTLPLEIQGRKTQEYSKQDIVNKISNKDNSNLFESRFERGNLPAPGKTPMSRLRWYWNKVYTARYGVAPKIFLNGKDGGVLKALLKDYSEWQVAALMVEHIESTDKSLEEAAHPLSWMTNRIARYVADINTELNFDDTLQIGKYVEDYLTDLPTIR